MKELKELPPYAPIDPNIRRLLNELVREHNKLSKAVHELKEIVAKMDPDV